MTSNNVVTVDRIKNFFCLEKPLEKMYITPSLTNGLGIDKGERNSVPQLKRSEPKGTEYAQKYIDEAYSSNRELTRRQTLDLPGGPTVSLNEYNSMNDIEELSTSVVDIPSANDFEDDQSRDLYNTYFKKTARRYVSELPINNYREKILHLVETNQAVVVQGSTGCGKTTQVPQFILDEHARLGKYCNIVVTQPRKLAAISVARRVCHERNWTMGTVVGYQVAMDNKISVDTRLSYVTTGVLLQKLVNHRRMDMYTHIIIDEVHERDQDTDFVLLVVKKLLRENSRNVRIILMSATIDTMMFAKYFAYLGRDIPAPIVEVLGKHKEVTEHYLHELSKLGIELPTLDPMQPSIPEALYDIAVKLILIFDSMERKEQNARNMDPSSTAHRGTVLIFLPGYEEISTMSKKLAALECTKRLWVLPLHSSVTIEEQSRVFTQVASGVRKIIVSTNIAESSITVPDIKYVIDFCLTKCLVCETDTNYTSLRLEWASKANCVQRKGRAGRVDTGKVYRLVPYYFYEKHIPDTGIPEIKRCPLHQTVLGSKKLNFGEPQALLALALEPPDLTDIEKAVLTLKEVGALAVTVKGEVTPYDGDLTFVGRVMSSLPLDVKVSKLLILGYVFDCLEDCLVIAASLSQKCFLAKPFQKLLDAYKSRLSWADGTFSDCLAYLNTFNMWQSLSDQGQFNRPGFSEKEWGASNFVQIKSIKEVDMLVKELKKRLESHNIHVNYHKAVRSSAENILILKLAIAGAFFPNYFIQESINEKDVQRDVNNKDPLRTVSINGLPTNHGLLYAWAVHDMMWSCSTRMQIDFEGSKAYVQFDRSPHSEEFGALIAVYLAVKMRHLKIPLELQLFEPKEAEKRILQLRQLKEANVKNKGLPCNSVCVQLQAENLKQTPLPSINTTTIRIFISNIVDCGHFWARYADQKTNLNLEFLNEMINSLDQHRHKVIDSSSVKPGMLLLAPFCDRQQSPSALYYRARVEKVDTRRSNGEATVTVFYVDYGNVGTVGIKDLRQIGAIHSDVMTMPTLAFECQLSEVKPSALKSSNGLWTKEATEYFAREVNGKELDCKVYSVVQNVVRLEIFPYSNGNPTTLNKTLIEMGLADHTEESYASKQDQELRDQQNTYMTSKDLPLMESSAVHYTLDDTRDLRDLKKTTQIIRLRGPFNPLEVKYQGMTRVCGFKSVNIDRDSVNSVSLNSEPQDPQTQMLVGCHVGMNTTGSSLSVRNTTLLPKIRGLPALVGLLFAPFAEPRCDSKVRFYTGALCGLGYDPATGESLYPEHDLELTFDTEISTDDICEINSVRMAINLILNNENDLVEWSTIGLRKVRESIKDQIVCLLGKSRKPRNPEMFKKKYCWRQIPKEHILYPSQEEGNCAHVLPLHVGINLSTDDSLQVKMKEHLRNLYDKAGRSTERMVQECELCSKTLHSPRELMLHLDTAAHREKELKLIRD